MKLALIFASLAFAGAALAGPIDEGYCSRIADAIYAAEGKSKAKVAYGILSTPTRSPEHAREVCLRTIRRTWTRFEAAGSPGDFLDFLGNRYAPLNASNDPQRLNRHWVRNVRFFLSETKSGQKLKKVRQ